MSDPLVQRVTILATDIERRVRRLETLEGGGSAAPGTTSWPGFNDAGGNPADVGTVAADGVIDYPARRDHVHAITGGTILSRLLTVDGTGSGLDADLLDGQHAAAFAGTADVTAGTILAKLITVDGTGSGLDADTLDGLHATAFSGTAHTHTGVGHDHDSSYVQLAGDTMDFTAILDMNSGQLRNVHTLYGDTSIQIGANVGTPDFFIDVGGRIGMGTLSPSQKLHVVGNILSGTVITPALNASSAAGLRIEDDGGTLGLFVKDGGQVGIGTASPSEALEIVGNVKASGAYTGAALDVTGNIETDTLLTVNGTGNGVNVVGGDNGAGGGRYIQVGRNNNGSTPAAGHYRMAIRSGTVYHLWTDASGNVRIGTTEPTNANDGSGTVVGSQTSSLDSKTLLGGESDIAAVLDAVRAGAEAVRRFVYRSGAFDGQEFEGLVTDFAPRYGMDRDAEHPAGRALNEVTVIGDLLRAVAWLAERVEALERGR